MTPQNHPDRLLGERSALRIAFTVIGVIAMVIIMAVMNKIRRRAEVIIKILKGV
jgi:hypothetical protein